MSVREELLALTEKHKLFHPRDGVKWARRNPKSALHGILVWDDKIAGEKFRIEQVRNLIRIHVVSLDTGERELVSLSIDRHKGGYRRMENVMPAPDLRSILMTDALNELERVQRKYEHLTELAKVWGEVKKVRLKIAKGAHAEAAE